MNDIYNENTAYTALKKKIGMKPKCSKKDFEICLALLKEKHDLKSKIREIQNQIDAKQLEVEHSYMYILYGTEYTSLLEVINEWGEKNGVDAL